MIYVCKQYWKHRMKNIKRNVALLASEVAVLALTELKAIKPDL